MQSVQVCTGTCPAVPGKRWSLRPVGLCPTPDSYIKEISTAKGQSKATAENSSAGEELCVHRTSLTPPSLQSNPISTSAQTQTPSCHPWGCQSTRMKLCLLRMEDSREQEEKSRRAKGLSAISLAEDGKSHLGREKPSLSWPGCSSPLAHLPSQGQQMFGVNLPQDRNIQKVDGQMCR